MGFMISLTTYCRITNI